MKAVIFDFDGTIADSFSTVIAISFHLTRNSQLADLEQVKYLRDNGVSLTQAIKRLDIPKWRWPWLLQRGRSMMANQIHQVPVFPGIEEVLRALSKEKFQLFIISSNSATNVKKFLQDKNLLPYFDRIYGGAGLFDKAKIIRKVLKSEGLSSDSVVYVGDEVRDIVAASQVGIECIAVSWGYNSGKLLKKYSPRVVVDSSKQLKQSINEWGVVSGT